LLEIVLVIVIISVITALVVPSMFPDTVRSATDETRRLQQVLRLAVDEAQLTGVPLRWWARTHSYGFEMLSNQHWQPAAGDVFATRELDGVVIDRVVENGVDQQPEEEVVQASKQSEQVFFDRTKKTDDPLVGRVLVLPNGMVTMVDVVLVANRGQNQRHRLLIRPGPAGIAEEKDEGGK